MGDPAAGIVGKGVGAPALGGVVEGGELQREMDVSESELDKLPS